MIKFTKKFSFAHGGTIIEHFVKGQVVENPSERLKEVAIKEKVAVDATEKEPTETKKGKSK